MLVRFRQFVESVVGTKLKSTDWTLKTGKKSKPEYQRWGKSVWEPISKEEEKAALRIIKALKKSGIKKDSKEFELMYAKPSKTIAAIFDKEMEKIGYGWYGNNERRFRVDRMNDIVDMVWRDMDPAFFELSPEVKAKIKAREEEEKRKEEEEWKKLQAQYARDDHHKEMNLQVNKILKKAAAMARKMGHNVESSKGRDGRISSYYVKAYLGPRDSRLLRISNHYLPDTQQRQIMRDIHGGESPFTAQIIIDLEGPHGEEKIVLIYDTERDSREKVFDYSDATLKKAIQVGLDDGRARDI